MTSKPLAIICLATATGVSWIATSGALQNPVTPATITVALRVESDPGGIPTKRANAFKQALVSCTECQGFVSLSNGTSRIDFELTKGFSDELEIRDHEGKIRKSFAKADSEAQEAISTLIGFAVQLRLLAKYSGAPERTQNLALFEIRVVPQQSTSCVAATWAHPDATGIQAIPLCAKWKVGIELSEKATKAWSVSAFVLSNDGAIRSLLSDDNTASAILNPNRRRYDFPGTVTAKPPVGILEHVLVLWMRQPPNTHPAVGATSDPQSKYLELLAIAGTYSAIGMTIPITVKANDPFLEAGGSQIPQREYTIPKFDIRPYLPEDKNTTLYRVLEEEYWLANLASDKGVGYKQHDWMRPTDTKNLQLGIDCSRALWFAFTRAGLRYNRSNSYISTADMVTNNSLMSDEFDRLPITAPLEIGDILVYRDEVQKDGHVVMVIDPGARIAWGSHGFDGRVKRHEVAVPAIGVQYQKIRYKPDWIRWDRKNMTLTAIWRHRTIARENRTLGGQPGLKIFDHACDAKLRCGLGL